MKVCILLALIAFAISSPLLGQCTMAPKNRPISCYEGKVLREDMPELMELLEKYKGDGDDNEFALYLGDMFDKKEFREGKVPNEEEGQKLLGKCGMAPQYQPYECYETKVLRRDRPQLKILYEKYHESDLSKFNEEYVSMIDKKFAYYGVSYE